VHRLPEAAPHVEELHAKAEFFGDPQRVVAAKTDRLVLVVIEPLQAIRRKLAWRFVRRGGERASSAFQSCVAEPRRL